MKPFNTEKNLLPPTEASHSRVHAFDALSPQEMVRAMNEEDAGLAAVIAQQETAIAQVMGEAARAFAANGRLIYLGAGTSGRLGILDAAECPPTFGVRPDQVIALIAGGIEAIQHSVEGAEDDKASAKRDLEALDPPVCSNDLVVGISASGTTPYVLAGLEKAQACGAGIVLLCCNPAQQSAFEQVIALDTGPEILTGSTRLKAGTAVKMVLNMISTGAMALSGRVFEGLMVGLKPVNTKLRDRAVRIVAELTDTDPARAASLLEEADDQVAVAVLMARRSMSVEDAKQCLAQAGGSLRAALDREEAP